MKFSIRTCGTGELFEVNLEDFGSAYPDDDVIYVDGEPCYLSSIKSVELEAAEARAASKTELINIILATWEPMADRLLEAEAERDAAQRELQQEHNREQMDRAVMTEAGEKINELREQLQQAQRTIEAQARELEQAQAALLKIHEVAFRASLVQDRSVRIIKQACASISIDAKDAAVQAARS